METQLDTLYKNLKTYVAATKQEKRTPTKTRALQEADFFEVLDKWERTTPKPNEKVLTNLLYPIDKTPLENEAQHEAAEHLAWSVTQNAHDGEAYKKDVNTLLELWKLADKNAKLKNDKIWAANNLSKADKALDEALVAYEVVTEQTAYWHFHIAWLQKRFPEAKYKDVVGLCKMADRAEYAEEQGYSLNAGRYVGMEIEEDIITEEEFVNQLIIKSKALNILNQSSSELEEVISSRLKLIIHEK
ncbi:hypothetical protein K8352_08750 [Flavobacteriaceae bacterium F89]|uniref:Uncharacterized protein n=1 Tax=Cerina litoralis TaxID=2874477 RepID=A0AAE3EWB6_9FLAO|nr:hypothetical protein [Cerina litoralis]MCG2460836.1 hypothetical protein [Cerina litoralis]